MFDAKARIYAVVYEANRPHCNHEIALKRAAEAVDHFAKVATKNIELRGVEKPRENSGPR